VDAAPSTQLVPPAEAEVRPRVLAVDDQPDALRVIRLRLNAAGMECVTAESGALALEFLDKNEVDVVLLDVMMPGMDGYEVCRRIKHRARTRDLPVIFLSANNQAEERARGFDAGAMDFIGKPVEQSELLTRTRSALTIRKLKEELQRQTKLQVEHGEIRQRAQEDLARIQHGVMVAQWQRLFGQLAVAAVQEIENPLANGSSSIQMLMADDTVPSSVRERLRLTDDCLRRVGERIRRLLVVACPARQPQRISLARLLSDLIALMERELLLQRIHLTLRLDPGAEWQGMPSELARAFYYILANAIEAVAGHEAPAITVAVEHGADHHQIHVMDNGAGVPADVQPRVFDPFFTTKGSPHCGAGLQLANAIVKAAGGIISLKSPDSGGLTCFTISLPNKFATPVAHA
jgi:two-component system sensor histidine kinase/response regulator